MAITPSGLLAAASSAICFSPGVSISPLWSPVVQGIAAFSKPASRLFARIRPIRDGLAQVSDRATQA